MAHRVSQRAEADLADIWYYIAKESGSIEIANRLIDSISNRFFSLLLIRTWAAPERMTSELAHAVPLSENTSSSIASRTRVC